MWGGMEGPPFVFKEIGCWDENRVVADNALHRAYAALAKAVLLPTPDVGLLA